MSEGGFHVHGAHDHAVEHAAHHGPGLAQWVAIFTAILSTLGAVVAYQGGNTQNEAILYKNEAVLKKTLASDQWNFYQALSTKQHLMELARDILAGKNQAYYAAKIAKYQNQKVAIKAQAEALEAASSKANAESARLLRPHHRLAQALTLIQVAISLASITVLTRKRWLFALAGIAAAGGIVLWVNALLL